MLRYITLYSSVGFLVVFAVLQAFIIFYTWYSRKRMSQLEGELALYTEELNALLLHGSDAIPEEFFSKKISCREEVTLLTRYIHDSCIATRNPHIDRVRDYSVKVGLTARLRKTCCSRDMWKRANAMRLLAEVGDSSDVPLFRAALEDNVDRPEILAAAIGLANNGIKDCIPLIVSKLYNVKSPNRDEVLSVISYYYPNAVEPCIDLIGDPAFDVALRTTLIDFLGVRKAQAARSAIEDLLRESDDDGIILHAIEALEKVGEEDTCSLILPYMKHADFKIRLKAVNALERLAGDRYIGEAEQLMTDGDIFVRRNAAEAISRMGDKGRRKLEELAQSDIRDVAVIAKMVMAEQEFGKIRWRFRYGDSIP